VTCTSTKSLGSQLQAAVEGCQIQKHANLACSANCFMSAGFDDRDADSERKQTKRCAVNTTLGGYLDWISQINCNFVKATRICDRDKIDIQTEKVCCFLE
jgi:hypothetical protein